MRLFNKLSILALSSAFFLPMACTGLLDDPLENVQKVEETDYTQTENMMLLVYGAYAQLNDLQWESFPTIALRGDDVNPAGDQQPLIQTDLFVYDRNFWLYNSTWLNLYSDIIYWHGAMEELMKYQEAGASAALTNQYIAEMKVMRAFELLQLARLWSDILIPTNSQPRDLYNVELSSFNEVMEHISAQMDEAIPNLAAVRPNQRTDVPGGITRFTALAVKAMANLEIGNYQAAADATGEIIAEGNFTLQDDYYQLFKIPGKLSSESLMELQYSDYGTATGTVNRYLWDFFGPASWTPSVAGAGGGWGFWEPSATYVKFMLDRGERERLEATVLFTPDGIAQIKSDPAYANLPSWITNVSKDGDVFNNHPRYKFLSGKFYLPSTQLTPGRFSYGENKNFSVIRYSEVLLMHAEALTSGANSSVMSADEAVNAVRSRVGMDALSGVTLDDVLDEKFAEFATEWGIRFFDLVRHGKIAPLSYEGRTYTEADRFLPYPLEQVDILPQLKEVSKP
ncbi:RagB/SusD family nutrient uptake outer membrane protein [Algoriphagus aestuariicola]|uniref:RagB/SusD family nutrient uptake outer membrane protein n=1 Tax=Algoriphagus aestuariicola TaxID=1852016 RepID=A0ABS3BM38_9BACT|nr:RagB/SusD family nutrient uptake outer membrane protein [Algoriphagus aestuariicola]MBN7800351.1 RagB/SusD family nutrient uptake outer membrane protein [Algoriphagus aestuariicola]